MSEEIKQKDKLKDGFEDLVINDTGKNFDDDMFIIQDWWLKQFDSLLSQALQKRDSQIIKMLENTDVQMSVSGDVGQDEIAMAKFIYKAHIKHIIKKIESAITPPNSINGTLPSETDSATK